MTDLVPYQPADTLAVAEDSWKLAAKIAGTPFVPTAFRGKPEAVLAAMLTGHEIGVGPMQALSKIHVIEGKPSMSSELMRAIVLRAGHEIWIEESTTTRVTVVGQRADSSRETRITWTMDDAKRAKLDGRDNWRKYPRAMLTARATAEVCRAIFPDVLAGISYTVEELTDGDIYDPLDEVQPSAIHETAPAKKTTTRKAKKAASRTKAKPKKKTAAPKAPARDRAPLPGEDDDGIIDAEVVDDKHPEEDPLAKARTRLILAAKSANVDHHEVVAAITSGRTSSSKDIDGDEMSRAIDAVQRIESGELVIVGGDEFPELRPGDALEAQDPTPDDEPVDAEIVDDGDDDTVSVDDADLDSKAGWQAFLRSAGVRASEALRQANEVAFDIQVDAPSTLAELAESDDDLRVLVATWVATKASER